MIAQLLPLPKDNCKLISQLGILFLSHQQTLSLAIKTQCQLTKSKELSGTAVKAHPYESDWSDEVIQVEVFTQNGLTLPV